MTDFGDLKVDSVLEGRFRIEGLIGRGGFATVYRGEQLSIDRPVAIKVLDPVDRGADDEDLRGRFFQEAKIAAKLEHPNIVNIIDYGIIESTNQPYIVMALLKGRDLGQELKEIGPLRPSRAVPLFVKVLRALGAGHRAGVIHKDLKPSNLFLVNVGQSDERLCVLDFGVARLDVEGPDAQRITQTGHFLGTPQYLAPEYVNDQVVTAALDVYQMGLILVEMLTGEPLIQAPTMVKCVVKSSIAEFTVPDALVLSSLGAVVQKALAFNHTDRYVDGNEFATALEAVDLTGLDTLKLARTTVDGVMTSIPSVSSSILTTPTRDSVDGIGYARTETTESLPPAVWSPEHIQAQESMEARNASKEQTVDSENPQIEEDAAIADQTNRPPTLDRSDLAWAAKQKRIPMAIVLGVLVMIGLLVWMILPGETPAPSGVKSTVKSVPVVAPPALEEEAQPPPATTEKLVPSEVRAAPKEIPAKGAQSVEAVIPSDGAPPTVRRDSPKKPEVIPEADKVKKTKTRRRKSVQKRPKVIKPRSKRVRRPKTAPKPPPSKPQVDDIIIK